MGGGATYRHHARRSRPLYRALGDNISITYSQGMPSFVIVKNTLTRRSRPNDKDPLPLMVLRRAVLRRVQHLAPELRAPRDLGHERVVPAQADREHDVADVQDARGAVGALHGDVPLAVRVLRRLLHRRGRPRVQLERLGVRFQPVRELVRGGVDGPGRGEAASEAPARQKEGGRERDAQMQRRVTHGI